jgi:hypothetical protein
VRRVDCCSIRQAGVTEGHGTGLDDEQTQDLEGWFEVLSLRVSDKPSQCSNRFYPPSNIPKPDLMIGTRVMLAGERISVG